MATVSQVRTPDAIGSAKAVYADVTFSASYSTGGEAITPSLLGFGRSIDLVLVSQASGLFVQPVYNTDGSANLKVLYPSGGAGTPASGATPAAVNSVPTATLANAVVPSGGTAVTSTAAQPTLTITQPTISAPALSPGVGVEVPAARDLSTIKVRCLFFGA